MVDNPRGQRPIQAGESERVIADLQARVRVLEQRLGAEASALADLRLNQARLAEAERIAKVGSFEWDVGADKVTWSPGLFSLFGIAPEHFEATYKGYLDRVHSDDRDFVDRRIRTAIERGTSVDHSYRIVRSDGTIRMMRSRCEAVRNAQGQVVKLQGTCQDVTDEFEAKRAQELARIKDHFLSSVSHEMKTPLSLVIGYAELLQDRYPGCELLEGIQDGARRLADLVGNIVDLAALLGGSLTLYRTDVSLPEAAEHAVSSVARQSAIKHVSVDVALEPGLPPIWADARRVVQMLAELLDNAVKFSPAGGTVRLEGRAAGETVRLVVADQGPGLEASALSRIFEAFHQEEVGSAMRKGGVGIGLAIVKLLAELHGGRVEVESRPGTGSRFTLVLPTGTAAS